VADRKTGEILAPALERPFARALRNAISDVKGLSGLILALAGMIAAYITLQHATPLPGPWPIIGSLVPIPLFILFYVWPEWRDAVAQKRLKELGIQGTLRSPGYFRLIPYEERDSATYVRPDAADADLARWISGATSPILYVSGQSGAGKSSVLSAGVTPLLRKADPDWIVITTRPQDDALSAIKRGLLAPDVVWQRAPRGSEMMSPLDLAGRAADYLFDHDHRLLIIIDQFEEALILFSEEGRRPLTDFLSNCSTNPREGLRVILSLRSEYIADLERFRIPPPTLGRNCFEVRPFTQASAREFIERSGLSIGESLMNAVFEEVAEIEDMPDRVRPVVLNMIGLVLASFRGILPKGVTPGRLLSGYVRNSVSTSDIRSVAPRVLRPLVTSLGTKRALSLADISKDSGHDATVVRGCLIRLADRGLVRTVDGAGERWELAHDFVARLVQPIIQTWRQTAWETARPWLAPSTLVAWMLILGGLSFLFSSWNLDFARKSLDHAGLSLEAEPRSGGVSIRYNGQQVDADTLKKATAYLTKVYSPITQLSLESASQLSSLEGLTLPASVEVLSLSRSGLTTLVGMPSLANLSELDLAGTNLQSLSGMPDLPRLKKLKLEFAGDLRTLVGMPTLPELTDLDLTYTISLETMAGMPTLPKLQALALSHSRLIKSFAGMPTFPALVQLKLGNMPNVSLSSLPMQPKLDKLKLERMSIAGMPTLDIRELELSSIRFTGMPVLQKLKRLSLSGFEPITFQGMPVFPSLTSLEIQGPVSSFVGMPSQPNLASITTRLGDVSSLDGLPSFPSLTTLDVSLSPRLKTLAGISNLPKIKVLNARNTGIDSWKDTADLPSLLELDLGRTALASLVDMPAYPRLQKLNLSGTLLSSLEGMPTLPSLIELKLSESNLSSLTGLPTLPKLEKLDVAQTPLKSLDGLKSATQLKSLALGTEIETLEELPSLPRLTELFVQNGRLTSLKGMPDLPALNTLSLRGARDLTNLQGMERFPSIESLDISETGIANLDTAPVLPNLSKLVLSTEQLLSMPKWIKLKRLSVRGKAITSFRPLRDIQQRPNELVLNVDAVSDWSSLIELPELETLTLVGSSMPPITLLAQLAKLKKLTLSRFNLSSIDFGPLAGLTRDFTIEVPENVRNAIRAPSNIKISCMEGPCPEPK
jgi:hypothetical protein